MLYLQSHACLHPCILQGAIYAGSLTLLGATLGTYQKYPNYGYFIDPAFIPSDNYNGTLSLMSPDPNSPSEQALLANVTAGISLAAANANTTLTVVPLATQQVWVPSADDINQELYCGYKQARCNGTSVIEGITNAWDFGNTNPAAGQYSMRLWYNGTGRYDDGGNQPTQVVRVHAAINVATNAFLKWALGMSGAAQLVGIMEMPKVRLISNPIFAPQLLLHAVPQA